MGHRRGLRLEERPSKTHRSLLVEQVSRRRFLSGAAAVSSVGTPAGPPRGYEPLRVPRLEHHQADRWTIPEYS
jgi:hypothetical protein